MVLFFWKLFLFSLLVFCKKVKKVKSEKLESNMTSAMEYVSNWLRALPRVRDPVGKCMRVVEVCTVFRSLSHAKSLGASDWE